MSMFVALTFALCRIRKHVLHFAALSSVGSKIVLFSVSEDIELNANTEIYCISK